MPQETILFTQAYQNAKDEIDGVGGHVTHKLTDTLMVVNLPDSIDPATLRHSSPNPPSSLDETSQLALDAWRALQVKASRAAPDATEGLSWGTPGYEAPRNPSNDPDLAAQEDQWGEKKRGKPPITSSYMIGSIAVGVVIVSGKKNGKFEITQTESGKIFTEILEGLSFLQKAEPLAGITFNNKIHILTVDAPVDCDPDPDDRQRYEKCEAPWRDPALKQLGYAAGYQGVLAYVQALKKATSSDWAYVVFVTKYPLAHFAYASGVRIVINYSNDGWGVDKINRTFAHETCHIFGAADEYSTKDTKCSCEPSGFLNWPNNNCEECTKSQAPCLMHGNTLDLCDCTRKQIGWDDALYNDPSIMGGRLRVTGVFNQDEYTWGTATSAEIELGKGVISLSRFVNVTHGTLNLYVSPATDAGSSIVGGRYRIAKSPDDPPSITWNSWGQSTEQEVIVANFDCYTDDYGESFGILSFYMKDSSGPPVPFVGGRLRVSTSDSSSQWFEASKWGKVTKNEVVIAHFYCSSDKYGPSSYGQVSLYLPEQS